MQQTAATADLSGSAVGASPSRKALFVAGVQSQLIFAAAIGFYWLAYRLFVRSHQNVINTDVLELLLNFIIFAIPILLLAHVVMRFWHMCRHVRPKRPSLWLLKDGIAFFSDPKRLALGMPMVMLLIVFMNIFTDIKKNIPNLVPFSWDQTFAEWDRMLHFGSHPWEWLQPILGYGPITLIVNFSYNFWFMVMWMLWMHFAFARETSILRTRFFLSFILTWAIGGSLAAVFLSSAGPCYYTLIGLSPDPYAELMAYLRQTNEVYPLMAIGIQDVLWSSYINKAMIAGISAMPSMHNAASLLFALTGWHMSRRMGWILSAHCAAVYIGSIHLGWHYAIDAYVGWAIGLAIWMICKPVAEWWERQPAMLRASRVFQAQTVAPAQGLAAA